MNAPAIHTLSLLQFAPFLAKRNIDVLDFFGRLGISPNIFQAHDAWVPRATCLQLANALVTETGSPFAGAFLGDSISVPDFGELGRLATNAETVGTCCRTVIDNLDLVHRRSQVTPLYERDRLLLRFSLEGDLVHDPRQLILASLGVLRNIVLLSSETDMVKVRLSISYTRQCSVLEDCFGENLEFGCEFNEIEVHRDLLEKPLENQLKSNGGNGALETTVKATQIIVEMLPQHSVGIDFVAGSLGLTRRTLQRRLRDCGIVYSDLIDVTRRDSAIRQLRSGCPSLKELAFELGYSDPAHFTRSFKRWTGKAPSAYLKR